MPEFTDPTEDLTFHEGEKAMQRLAGAREHLAQIGSRVIRDHMPEQHRTFFAQLPFLVVGSVDAQGQPWASVLAATPGFASSPDPRVLNVKARPLPHDPLNDTLALGVSLGLLGIEPATRRRNRLNGVVSDVGPGGFTVQVSQSFGNCPKYIQAREPVLVPDRGPIPALPALQVSAGLDAAARAIVEGADTFFIATAHPATQAPGGPAEGVDVSHRGGKPGFVRVGVDGNLTVPDFLGNYFFNTLGNLALEPRCGLLFIDFASGSLVWIAARGTVVWDEDQLAAYPGAQRLLRLEVTAVRRVDAVLPLRWGPAQPSPVLAPTGPWRLADDAVPSVGADPR